MYKNTGSMVLLIVIALYMISCSSNAHSYYENVAVPQPHFPAMAIQRNALASYVLAYCWRPPEGRQSPVNQDDREVVVAIHRANLNTATIFNSYSATLSQNAIYKFGCVEEGDRIRYLGHALSWRPGSSQLSFVSGIASTLTNFSIISVSADLELSDASESINQESYYPFFHDPQNIFWSPDGQKFATLAFNTDLSAGGGPNIWVYDMTSRKVSAAGKRTRIGNTITNATWSHNGDDIAIGYGHPYSGMAITDYDDSDVYIEVTSGVIDFLQDWPYPLEDPLLFTLSNRTVEFNYYIARNSRPLWLDNDSRILFVAANQDQQAVLFVVDSDGSDLHELLPGLPGIVALPELSPDGNNLAFIRYPSWKHRNRVEIAILDFSTMELRSLCVLSASQGGDDLLISGMDWSPDGKYLAFSSNHEGESNIYVIAEDGSAWLNLTENIDDDAVSPAWKP